MYQNGKYDKYDIYCFHANEWFCKFQKMSQHLLRAVIRSGRASTFFRALSTSARCGAAQYPDAKYVQDMPDDIDFHYPKLGTDVLRVH